MSNSNISVTVNSSKSDKKVLSVKSSDSIASIGIGTEDSCRLKIIPEGSINLYERLYDCVVFLIYCPEHRNIAVLNSNKSRFIWMPFIQLRDDYTWVQGSLEGVSKIIGRMDAELDSDEAKKLSPEFSLSYWDITRIQLPTQNFIIRVCQLIKLESNNEFKCCTTNSQVEWLPLDQICQSMNDTDNSNNRAHWGPELKWWCLQLAAFTQNPNVCSNKLVTELTMPQCLHFFSTEANNSSEHKAMLGLKVKVEHAMEIYEDYLKHCYPSLYMGFDSFRSYLVKHNYNGTSKATGNSDTNQMHNQKLNMNRLYDSFRYKRNDYLDFHELLLGIVVMDPKCKDKCEARIRFLFRYYSAQKNCFNEEDLRRLISDTYANNVNNNNNNNNANNNKAEMAIQFNDTLHQFGVQEANKISFTVFYKAVVSQPFLVSKLCRFTRSLLQQISSNYAQKVSKKHSVEKVKSKCSDLGIECLACRPHRYEYGMNSVTFDTTGRCIDPRVVNKNWLEESLYQQTRIYSMEYTFSFRSVSSIFLDFVKDFNRNKSYGMLGLMANKEDWNTLVKYLKILCRLINGLLLAEPKLLKLNGPAIVIGDLQGSLSDLLTFEECLYPSFPVVPENLIFLGNYSGEYTYGVECLIYLFSLKISSPNKVFLLRGNNETRNQSYKCLKNECIQKYGRIKGDLVFEAFNDVFAKLPVAAIVDESILCVHSGIPYSTNKINDLTELPKNLTDVKKQAPMVFEMFTRYPNTYNTNMNNDCLDAYFGERNGDLTFHSSSHSCSLSSIESNSFSELALNSAEIKSTQIEDSSVKSNLFRKLYSHPNKYSSQASIQNANNSSLTFEKSISDSIKPYITKLKSLALLNKMNKPPQSKSHSNSRKQPIKLSEMFLEETMMFDRKAFNDFMQFNELEFLVRTGSVCKKGFKVNFRNRCLTIFSCTNFCNYQNNASALLIDRSNCRLRFLCIEPTNNNNNTANTTTTNPTTISTSTITSNNDNVNANEDNTATGNNNNES